MADFMLDVTQFSVSTRQADAGWSPQGNKETVHTFPIPGNSVHRFRWRSYWVQASLQGAQISLLFHSCDKSVLLEFIEAARLQYADASMSRVNVHLTDGYGHWGRVVSKTRRSFATLVLPDGIKETLLADMKEFLDNEQWCTCAAPRLLNRYLLFGDPGTGKSTTVHALAGELGMEIYFISLASGVNDYSLGELFHSTPPHSILLIEDIDCAVPTRGDSDEYQSQADDDGRMPEMLMKRRSEVTLAGLLNILDSVASQEGRILIATTNHIDQLDPGTQSPTSHPAQIRYKLATNEQLENVFHRFYPGNNDVANPLVTLGYRHVRHTRRHPSTSLSTGLHACWACCRPILDISEWPWVRRTTSAARTRAKNKSMNFIKKLRVWGDAPRRRGSNGNKIMCIGPGMGEIWMI
ncbi:P-loop containing nucleoside triphosphate hydrolase protein [Mycena galopus ATCC 62051]|nr:P-loop containing nucleoside triphosphate hydrolase protein [Mycena galopus ATCC 62051]